MTPTSVGMRCPECSRERTKVRTIGSVSGVPSVTQVLIGLNVIVFLAETAAGAGFSSGGGGWVFNHGDLYGFAIAHQHQYWRLVSSGFLHDGIFHILVNMVSLYFVGRALEPGIGQLKFGVIYVVSLLGGSFGALLFSPGIPTIGASGAIFGIFGALIVVARARGISIWQSGLGLTLLINIVFSLSVSGISIGGHLGGVAGGAICGWLIVQLGERRRMQAAAIAGCALVAVVSVIAAIALSGGAGLAPNGLTI
jgi:membrane associated rhomboid family serine protease